MSTDSSVAAWPLFPAVGCRLGEGVLEPQDLCLGSFQHADQLGVVLRRGSELAVNVPELVPENIDLPLCDGKFGGGVPVAIAGCGGACDSFRCVLGRCAARVSVRSLHRASAPS